MAVPTSSQIMTLLPRLLVSLRDDAGSDDESVRCAVRARHPSTASELPRRLSADQLPGRHQRRAPTASSPSPCTRSGSAENILGTLLGGPSSATATRVRALRADTAGLLERVDAAHRRIQLALDR
jgi:hypothetical protein